MQSDATKSRPSEAPIPENKALATSGMETQTAKPSTRKFKVLLALAVAGTVVFFVVLLLSAVAGKAETNPLPRKQPSFCCPEEATMVLGVLNTSVNPCDDFYAHVCSRIDSGAATHYELVSRAVMSWTFLDYAAWDAATNPAGALIAFLMKGAWEESGSPAEELVEYATAVLDVTSLNTSADMDIRNTLRLFARLSLRYGLPTVLAFNVSASGEVLNIERNDGCFGDYMNENTSIPALMAVNNALKTSVAMNDMIMLEGALPIRRGGSQIDVLTAEITSSPFKALSDFEWRALVNELVFPVYPNVTSVAMRKEDQISKFVDVLGGMTQQPVLTAYTTICAAIRLRNRVQELVLMYPHSIISVACKALDVCEIVDRLQATVVSSWMKNDYVRALFAHLRSKVLAQASRHALFTDVSNESLEKKFGRIKLMLPEQIAVSNIAVPDISETFAASYLAARSYTFDVRSAKVAQQIPNPDSLFLPLTVMRGDVIYVPTNLYRLLHNSRGKLKKVLDIPLIGVDLALNLWSYLLQNRWPNETRRNVESRLTCVHSSYLNDSSPSDFRRTVTAALGLRSAIDAMASPEWGTVYTVNSAELSVGRLLYLLWAYDQCRSLPTLMPRVDVNFVVRNSVTFPGTFLCSRSSPMAQRNECFDKNWINT